MATKITLPYDGANYTLEFNRKTVQWMEGEGFDLKLLESKVFTMIPILIIGAFRMHHRRLESDFILDKVWLAQTHRQQLLGKLSEMYAETFEFLLDSDEGKDEGNATWAVQK